MQELEKILEEIENTFKENIENIEDENGVHHFVIDSFTATFLAKEIIRKHMNDGWIPVEERMPEESLNSVIGWDEERKRCCFVQRWGGRWIFGNDIDSVKITAWRPLPETYRPERRRN